MKNKVILLFMLVFLFTACGKTKYGSFVKDYAGGIIYFIELKDWIKEGFRFVLIDLRSLNHYQNGHIETAISIPYTHLERKIENKIPLDAIIVVYAGEDAIQKSAYKTLRNLGYKYVKIFSGGIRSWQYDLVKE